MYSFDSRIRYSETDSEGRMTLVSLLNYFQDCTTLQSEELGLGIAYTRERKLAWVLSAWQIEVERFPRLGERVKICTHPYEFKSFMGSRNFCMLDEQGAYLAKANTLWSLLNTETGKPSLPTEDMLKKYILEEKLPMDYASRKIPIPPGGRKQEAIVVRKHHLDTNHHVNNVQYVNIAMEYLPEHFAITRMRAEYKKQAFLEDVMYPWVVPVEDGYVIAILDEKENPYVVVEFLGKEKSGTDD